MTTLNHEYRNYSLSSATMRNADLIPTFASFLEDNAKDLYDSIFSDNEYKAILDNEDYDNETADYLLNEDLFDALNEIAPDGCYFGSNEGNGSDYGFWAFEDDSAYFDRFDICEAYWQLEVDYNISGVLQERKSNKRRNMSTGYQLSRMHFKISPLHMNYNDLSDNAKAIYNNWLYNHYM